MKKILILLFLLIPTICFARMTGGGVTTSNVMIQEEDGSPSGKLNKLRVTNDSLTKNAEGDYSLDTGAGGASVSDTAYDATSWDNVTTIAPSKNAVRDKIETLSGGHDPVTVTDTTTIDLTLTGQDIKADGLYTAGDALTLTGADFNFDGGASPGGELGGTWASPTIDDGVAVSNWNLTTPTITTSLTTDGKTISEAEIGVLDGGIEGTEIKSTGEAGGTKYLREDGDGTCSWQTPAAAHDAVTLDANADTFLSLSTQELGLDTQAANRVLAGPAAGAAAVPTFRALVDDDIPNDITITEADPLSATMALDNLASVAINTSLLSDTAGTDDLGTEALYWKKLYLGSDISFEGATDNDYQTTLTAVDTTLSDKSINIPDASGTMAVSASTPIALSVLGDISHSTASGYVHLPAGGSSAQMIQYSSAGTGKWVSLSGDATIADGGAITVADDSHTHGDSTISDTITVGASGSVHDSAIPAGITRDTEWDTIAKINAASTDADILIFQTIAVAGQDNVVTDAIADTLTLVGGGITAITTNATTDTITITSTETDPNALLTAGTDNVKDTHIDWGTGPNQVSADDIPDGVTNAIITLTQETNFTTAYDHSQDNTQAHSDYLTNNAADTLAVAGDASLTIYSNTDTPTADAKLLILQKGIAPSEIFSVDEDGDTLIAGTLGVTGQITGNLTGDVTGNVSGSSGSCTGNAATATLASTITTTDNENTDENNLIPFVADAAGPGSSALETDGDFYYNPSTGKITATGFVGALTGNVTGTASGNLVSADINTYSELNTIVADVTLTHNGLIDTFAELDAIVADKTLVNTADAQTLASKRITPRITSTASATSWTIDSDSYDMAIQTALAGDCTINAPSGTPTQGQKLVIRIKDNGSARSLSWNAIFRASSDLSLPTTTTINKTMYLGFFYNDTDTKWDLLAYLDNF